MTVPQPYYRNQGNTGSFFASQNVNPTGNPLVTGQVDPTAPNVTGLKRVSNPIKPSSNAKVYTANFDPALYDLRDSSHLMRLVRAMAGPPGIGSLQKQYLIARLANMLGDGSFLDLDRFYGAIFGLQRHIHETFPTNYDGTTVNPYTDLAVPEVWDEVLSQDAKYRSQLFLLARAINMGTTMPGLKGAAEAVLSCEVDVVESWIRTDFNNVNGQLKVPYGVSYGAIKAMYVNWSGLKRVSFGTLSGTHFGEGELPAGNRGELVFVPHRSISLEERYQLKGVLNTIKPSNVQITISKPTIEALSTVTSRSYSSDSENWQIQSRVTPALGLIDPATPIYNNAGPYSQARPVYSEYTGEQWTYNPNVVRAVSYQIEGTSQSSSDDDQIITYNDNYSHVYQASDSVRDVRQAISARLSGEGVVTNMPYNGNRAQYFTDPYGS